MLPICTAIAHAGVRKECQGHTRGNSKQIARPSQTTGSYVYIEATQILATFSERWQFSFEVEVGSYIYMELLWERQLVVVVECRCYCLCELEPFCAKETRE